MERAIAEMEKIRRAEEIYSRRKNLDEEKKNQPKSIYKVLFEVLFLINVVVIIVAVQNQKYIFTEDFIKKVNSYNINVKNKVEEIFTNTTKKDSSKNNSSNQQKEKINAVEENTGVSGESNNVTSALVENEIIQTLSQEEQDILEIKKNYSVILPVKGVKTSGFGERESTNSKVTKNHTGIDIATTQGTSIKSATDGKVIQVSSSGDYGKHIRVQINDLVVLYAHCSKISVKEGQEIKQGEEIGAVGSTGNSTGPHLHFELKFHDRLVNPEKIVEVLEF